MQPNDRQLQTPGTRGQVQPPARDPETGREAVADLTRDKIDRIYSDQATTEQTATPSPYHRTHDETHHGTLTHDWNQYHSAWQSYYQKYYERYYVGAVSQAHQTYQAHAAKLQSEAAKSQSTPQTSPATDASVSEEEALYDLRSQLLDKVQHSAKKVRKSRHFIPMISAVCVLLVFAFLQYNSIIFSYAQAYVSPGNIDPQNIIVDPNTSLKVGPAPRLIIPKLNVDIKVDYGAKPDYDSQMAAMKTGVAYFGIPGANSRPGQLGNVPISGHSSNEFYDDGAAKFIFARLSQLKKGDTFYLNYKGTRYTYSVTHSKVVKPTEVTALQIGDNKPMVTLITCTPIGTAEKRLLVFAEQISPSPSTAKPAPGSSSQTEAVPELTGKSPTLLERAFGAR